MTVPGPAGLESGRAFHPLVARLTRGKTGLLVTIPDKEDLVADQRLRNTPQRTIILEELQGLHSHPTAKELYAVVRRRLPRISLGTVYRNLEILVRLGLACKLLQGGGEARFDGDVRAHVHVHCDGCGRLMDAPGVLPPALRLPRRGPDGFRIFGQRLELVGLCRDCQRQEHASAPEGARS
jgi:Fur family ferric uptake transcriptional regulator